MYFHTLTPNHFRSTTCKSCLLVCTIYSSRSGEFLWSSLYSDNASLLSLKWLTTELLLIILLPSVEWASMASSKTHLFGYCLYPQNLCVEAQRSWQCFVIWCEGPWEPKLLYTADSQIILNLSMYYLLHLYIIKTFIYFIVNMAR